MPSAVAMPRPEAKPLGQPRSSVRRMQSSAIGPTGAAMASPISSPRTTNPIPLATDRPPHGAKGYPNLAGLAVPHDVDPGQAGVELDHLALAVGEPDRLVVVPHGDVGIAHVPGGLDHLAVGVDVGRAGAQHVVPDRV